MLRGQEVGMKVAEVRSAHAIFGADILHPEGKVRWHERVECWTPEAARAENAKLKKLLAEATLDVAALKDITSVIGADRSAVR